MNTNIDVNTNLSEAFDIYVKINELIDDDPDIKQTLNTLYRTKTTYVERRKVFVEQREEIEKKIDDLDDAIAWADNDIDVILHKLSQK